MKLDAREYEELKRRVSINLNHIKMEQDIDDVLHEILITRLLGKGQNQLLGHSIIDSIRKLFGDSRTKSHTKEVPTKDIFQWIRDEATGDEEKIIDEEWLDDAIDKVENSQFKKVMILKCIYDFNNKEIADFLGVKPPRINAIFKKIGEQVWAN